MFAFVAFSNAVGHSIELFKNALWQCSFILLSLIKKELLFTTCMFLCEPVLLLFFFPCLCMNVCVCVYESVSAHLYYIWLVSRSCQLGQIFPTSHRHTGKTHSFYLNFNKCSSVSSWFFFFLFLYRKKTFCPQANLRTFSVIFFGGAVAEHFSDFSYNVQILFSGLFFFS